MHWTSILGLLFCTIAWGAGFAAIKIGLEYLPPFLFVGLRFLATSGLLALIMWRRGTAFRFAATYWREMLALMLLFYAQQGLLFLGMQHTDAGRTGVVLNSQPIWTALFAHFFIARDRLSPPKVAGVLLGFAGVAVVLADRFGTRSPLALRGDLLILAAAIGWGVGTILTKRLAGKVSASTIVLWSAFGSCLLFLLTSRLLGETMESTLDARFWIATTYVVIVSTVIGFVLWNHLIQTNLPSLATTFCFVTPVASVFFGWLLLSEPLTSGIMLGTVLVAAGIVLANLWGANGNEVRRR